MQAEVKRLEKESANLRQRLAAGGGAQLEEADVDGIRLMLQRVDEQEKDLLVFADQALNRANGNGVAIVVQQVEELFRRAAIAGHRGAWANLGSLLARQGRIEELQPWLPHPRKLETETLTWVISPEE